MKSEFLCYVTTVANIQVFVKIRKKENFTKRKKKVGVRCEKNEKMKRKSFAPKKIHTRNFDPNF